MTEGFYKLDGDLLYGPNFVLGAYGAYELRKESHAEYTYPVDNWYWFDSEELAREFFGLPEKVSDSQETIGN
jgi:hypothetical protein